MTTPLWWRRSHTFILFAVIYGAAALAGRATVLDGGSVSLVWPAAGVGVVWLLVEAPRWWPAVLALGADTAVVLALTGAPGPLIVAGALSSVAQAVVAVSLVRRWCPGILGAGGTESIHTLAVLVRGAAAMAIGCLVGAGIGVAGLHLSGVRLEAADPVLWWGRQMVGIMFVGSVLHLGWERLRVGPHGPPLGRRRIEPAALVVISTAVYGTVFVQDVPVAFAVIPLSVWCATRFSTFLASLHTLALGVVAVTLTLAGSGPFADLASPEVSAMLTQVFLLVVLLTALAVGTLRDQREELVARVRAAESAAAVRAEMLGAVTEAMNEGLVVLDHSGEVLQVNDAARRLLERTPGGLAVNVDNYDLLRPDGSVLPAQERPSHRVLVEGEVAAKDVMIAMGAGGHRTLSVRATRLSTRSDISPAAALLVYRDVTDERSESRRLVEFAEHVAHDLRSPLTAVRGWMSLVERHLEHGPEGPLDLTLRAMSGVDRLSDLVDAMLDQALAEGADLRPEPLQWTGEDGLVAEVAELLGLEESVSCDEVPDAVADPRAVHQLLANLFGNAAKYSDQDRSLHVQVSGRTHGSRVVVDVSDNGRGIERDEQQQIFERFRRTSTRGESVPGVGIGLDICRVIVQRHGGEIHCLPGPDGLGTTFRFDLPARSMS